MFMYHQKAIGLIIGKCDCRHRHTSLSCSWLICPPLLFVLWLGLSSPIVSPLSCVSSLSFFSTLISSLFFFLQPSNVSAPSLFYPHEVFLALKLNFSFFLSSLFPISSFAPSPLIPDLSPSKPGVCSVQPHLDLFPCHLCLNFWPLLTVCVASLLMLI